MPPRGGAGDAGAAGWAGCDPAGADSGAAGPLLAGAEAGVSKIERVFVGRVASSVSSRLVVKKAAASPAVVLVRKLDAPRPRHEAAAAADAERSTLRLLQQHHADEGGRNHEMNDEQDGGHRRRSFRGACRVGAVSTPARGRTPNSACEGSAGPGGLGRQLGRRRSGAGARRTIGVVGFRLRLGGLGWRWRRRCLCGRIGLLGQSVLRWGSGLRLGLAADGGLGAAGAGAFLTAGGAFFSVPLASASWPSSFPSPAFAAGSSSTSGGSTTSGRPWQRNSKSSSSSSIRLISPSLSAARLALAHSGPLAMVPRTPVPSSCACSTLSLSHVSLSREAAFATPTCSSSAIM